MNFYASQKLVDDVDFDDRTSFSEKTSLYSGNEFENENENGTLSGFQLIHTIYVAPYLALNQAHLNASSFVERLWIVLFVYGGKRKEAKRRNVIYSKA